MNILDDPRQFPTRLEWPTTFEGAEQFPKWDAKLMDLDELPVEEYMKPMPVNVVSGGTGPGPGPEPTPSGETVYFSVSFEVSGETYGPYPVQSGTTTPQNMIPSPTKDGYTFSGWTPDPASTVITANTNFEGWFIENAAESAYYSTAMFLKGTEFDPTTLKECALEDFTQGKSIIFTIESSATYADMDRRLNLDEDDEEYISQREFDSWYNNEFVPNNQYVVRFVCPTDVEKQEISLKDEMNQAVPTPNPTIVMINGVEYNCFDFEETENYTFVPTEVEQQIKLTLKIDKN